MGLIRKVFWSALTLVFAFAFNVLFQYGPDNYVANAKSEFEALRTIMTPLKKKKDTSHSVPTK